MGYDVTVTGGSGDEGIDIVAELVVGIGAQRIGIQAKCLGSQREVGPNTVRLLRDALSSRECNAGAVVATCRFNDDAKRVAEEAGKPRVELVDADRLTVKGAFIGIRPLTWPGAFHAGGQLSGGGGSPTGDRTSHPRARRERPP